MTFANVLKLNISMLCLGLVCTCPAWATEYGVQSAWDNPTANMAAGSIKPGYAQLGWTAGSVLPVKLRNGMVTMITLPDGEQIADGVGHEPDCDG